MQIDGNFIPLTSRGIEAQVGRLPSLGLRWPIKLARPASDAQPISIVLAAKTREKMIAIVAASAVIPWFSNVDKVLVAEVDVAKDLARGSRVLSGSVVPFLDSCGQCAGRDRNGKKERSVLHSCGGVE
jgi:hypothetical protein